MKRILTGILLLVAGLTGLFMTLCGGGVSLAVVESNNQGFLAVSVPVLLVGILLLAMMPTWYRRWKGSAPSAAAPDEPPMM